MKRPPDYSSVYLWANRNMLQMYQESFIRNNPAKFVDTAWVNVDDLKGFLSTQEVHLISTHLMIVMNDTFLLFFFDMHLPYAFYLTYLNTSLPAGVHESPNTCLTCVCLMVNTPLPLIYHMFNMLFTHVQFTFCYYLNQ
jgi:hypothetical protein